MAAVPVIISGVIWNDAEKAGYKGVVYGELTIAGLGVGGGPVIPPEKPPLPPLGIWPGPGDPDYPIRPPGGGGGPIDPPPIKPPPIAIGDGDWKLVPVWHPSAGWIAVIVPVGDQPIPGPSK